MATKHTETTVHQPTAAPTAKVTAGAVGGAAATVIVVLFQMALSVEFPAGFEGAIAVLIAFAAAYMTPERVQGIEG